MFPSNSTENTSKRKPETKNHLPHAVLLLIIGLSVLLILITCYICCLIVCYKRKAKSGTFKHEKQTCCSQEDGEWPPLMDHKAEESEKESTPGDANSSSNTTTAAGCNGGSELLCNPSV
jgi:hypothetical protein